MSYCMKCGKMVGDNEPFCPNCGTKNQEYNPNYQQSVSGSGSQYRSGPRTQGQGSQYGTTPKATVTSPVSSAERTQYASGEQVVRSYHCTSLKSPKCESYLTVTNKRVILHGVGGSSRLNQECWLDGISGIDSYYGKDIDMPGIIRGIIVGIVGIILMMSGDTMVLVGLIAIAIAAYMIYKSIRDCFVLKIFSSKIAGTGIVLGRGPSGLTGNSALYTLVGIPTSETNQMLDELGAMILDLQTLGDRAITKWRK